MHAYFIHEKLECCQGNKYCRDSKPVEKLHGKDFPVGQPGKTGAKKKNDESCAKKDRQFEQWFLQPVGTVLVIIQGQGKIDQRLQKSIDDNQINCLPKRRIIFYSCGHLCYYVKSFQM